MQAYKKHCATHSDPIITTIQVGLLSFPGEGGEIRLWSVYHLVLPRQCWHISVFGWVQGNIRDSRVAWL